MPKARIVPRDTIIAFFLSRGWSAHIAFGIAANVRAESDFNHNAIGDDGSAFSFFQHRGPRLARFEQMYGKPMSKAGPEEVLAFCHWELTSDPLYKKTGDALRRTRTPYQAAAEFCRTYERPKNLEGEMRKRGLEAQKWFEDAINSAVNKKPA